MKIDEKDIVRVAQELRDETNQQLHVHPWPRRHQFQFSTWLAAVPAAAIIGFVLGIWTNRHTQAELPLTALADTVYVMVKEASASPDTTPSISTPLPPQPAYRQVRSSKGSKQKRENHIGQPVMNDRIRYDLLVKN